MSTVKSKNLQVGTDATATNNFTIYQPSTPDGTLRIGVGNADSPTEVAQFTSAGMVSGATSLTTASGSAPSYSARAWVNFDGTLAAASMIRGSGNVSSMTDTGTGNYRVNYATVMSDSNYAAVAGTSNDSTIRLDLHATTNVRVVTNATAANAAIISVAIFR